MPLASDAESSVQCLAAQTTLILRTASRTATSRRSLRALCCLFLSCSTPLTALSLRGAQQTQCPAALHTGTSLRVLSRHRHSWPLFLAAGQHSTFFLYMHVFNKIFLNIHICGQQSHTTCRIFVLFSLKLMQQCLVPWKWLQFETSSRGAHQRFWI